MKGLTDATSQDVAWCPKHQTAKWCCWFDGHCLKEKDDIVSFLKGKIFFSFTHASSPFPLETSGSFFKFISFLFIYLFIFFKLIFFLYLFVPYKPCKWNGEKEKESVWRRSIYRKYVSLSRLPKRGTKFKWGRSFTHWSLASPGQWFPATDCLCASAIFVVGTSSIPPNLNYRSVSPKTLTTRFLELGRYKALHIFWTEHDFS